jgi:hypothetical protein
VKLPEIGEDDKWIAATVAVSGGLEIIVGRRNIAVRLFSLDVKTHVAKVWREVECVVGPALGRPTGTFDLDFLGVRVGLDVVVNVPAHRDEKLIDEVLARFRFLILGG